MLNKLEKWLKVAQIISLLAIPIVLAVIGWAIQASLSGNSIQQEYVKIAVSVLQSEKSEKTDVLRPWATDLLAKYSPVPMSGQQRSQLETGKTTLPLPPLHKMVNYRGVSMGEGFPERIKTAQKQTQYLINGKVFERVKYGSEKKWSYGYDRNKNPCHDCKVLIGEYHVPHCEVEECPRCIGQALGCGCDLNIPE